MTREEAIEELEILKEEYWADDGYGHETEQYNNTMFALDMAIEVLKQEPRKGKWISTHGNVKCSVCGSVKDRRDVGKATHYCDFCGAKMVEPQE